MSAALPDPAAAGNLDQAMVAYQTRRYGEALELLQPLAASGNPAAQNTLGLLYAKGLGTPRDDRLAVKWFRAAAKQGDAKARKNLAYMTANGRGGAHTGDTIEEEDCD